jgi:DNA-binding transcriptional ArsR family regulator
MTDPRTITDSRVLSAMSHPQRRRLLDALTVDGPSSVSMLSTRTGLAVGSVSHHMKMLAAGELVEEAPELARDRRERWWRLTNRSNRWSSTTFEHDPAAAIVAEAAMSIELEHHVEKVRAWNSRREEDQHGWTDAAFSTSTWLKLTPGELHELSRELVALLHRWSERPEGDEDGREAVFVFAHGVPAQP